MDFVFANNMEVAALETVPEAFRQMYKPKEGGGFKVDTEHGGIAQAVSAITGLHNSLNAARAEATGLKGKSVDLSLLGEYGTDVGTIAEGFKKKVGGLEEKITDLQKGGKINPEKIKEELAGQFSNEIKGKDLRIGALTNQLYGLLVEQTATEAIRSQGGDPKLLMPFVQKQVAVAEEEGKFNVYIVNEKNERQYSGATGQPLSMPELIVKMKGDPTFQPLFRSEAPSGMNSQNNQTHQKPGNLTNKQGDLNPTQKIALGLSKGQHSQGQPGAAQQKESFMPKG